MTDVTPAKLADAKIRVLNASGQGGQAAEVAGELRDLGFAQPAATNDTVYANTRLNARARSASVRPGGPPPRPCGCSRRALSCSRISRGDDTVDLASAPNSAALTHSDDIDAVLASLRPDATEPADPTLLKKIHTGAC